MRALCGASLQVLTSFFDDKSEEDDRRECAVYSDLTNTLVPQPCDRKHEWICKVARGKQRLVTPPLYMSTCSVTLLTLVCVAGEKLKKLYWYTERE